MMYSAIQKLISIGSTPICEPIDLSHTTIQGRQMALGLAEILGRKNGFYAYESALLVRPVARGSSPLGLAEWNATGLWKAAFDQNLDDTIFFAEDVFGGQFFLRGDHVWAFDPETGQSKAVSPSVEAWAEMVLSDYAFQTGFPIAHAWQLTNGPLKPGERLLPKVPFVCGGKYEVENLYLLDEVSGMTLRASLANQVYNLPDGAQIRLTINRDKRSDAT